MAADSTNCQVRELLQRIETQDKTIANLRCEVQDLEKRVEEDSSVQEERDRLKEEVTTLKLGALPLKQKGRKNRLASASSCTHPQYVEVSTARDVLDKKVKRLEEEKKVLLEHLSLAKVEVQVFINDFEEERRDREKAREVLDSREKELSDLKREMRLIEERDRMRVELKAEPSKEEDRAIAMSDRGSESKQKLLNDEIDTLRKDKEYFKLVYQEEVRMNDLLNSEMRSFREKVTYLSNQNDQLKATFEDAIRRPVADFRHMGKFELPLLEQEHNTLRVQDRRFPLEESNMKERGMAGYRVSRYFSPVGSPDELLKPVRFKPPLRAEDPTTGSQHRDRSQWYHSPHAHHGPHHVHHFDGARDAMMLTSLSTCSHQKDDFNRTCTQSSCPSPPRQMPAVDWRYTPDHLKRAGGDFSWRKPLVDESKVSGKLGSEGSFVRDENKKKIVTALEALERHIIVPEHEMPTVPASRRGEPPANVEVGELSDPEITGLKDRVKNPGALYEHQLNMDIREMVCKVLHEQQYSVDLRKPFDPNLVCPICKKQYRIGEIQEFKKHALVCDDSDALY